MTKWESTIRIGTYHKAFREGTMTVPELAYNVYSVLRRNKFFRSAHDVLIGEMDEFALDFDESDALNILEGFLELSKLPDATADDYDDILRELYYFADYNKRIWIDTIS